MQRISLVRGVTSSPNRRLIIALAVPAAAAIVQTIAIGAFVLNNPRSVSPPSVVAKANTPFRGTPAPSVETSSSRTLKPTVKDTHVSSEAFVIANPVIEQATPLGSPPESVETAREKLDASVVASVPPAPAKLKDFWDEPRLSAGELTLCAMKFTEVGLEKKMSPATLHAMFDVGVGINKVAEHGHIKRIIRERSDLHGLPFLLDDQCQLSPKPAAAMARYSSNVRLYLPDGAVGFWKRYQQQGTSPGLSRAELIGATRTLDQMLDRESGAHRSIWIQKLGRGTEPETTQTIARRAVFDFDPNVRRAAVTSLVSRPSEDYTEIVLAGFRYPWSPIARHAAEALVALERTDLVATLEALRDSPNPFITQNSAGGSLREVVRIEHSTNCFLCHPPIDRLEGIRARLAGSFPVGNIPDPTVFPVAYYQERSSLDIMARADITYLRQDFSAMVRESMNGIELARRYDFLVRSRPLSPGQLAALPASLAASPNGSALDFALARLTSGQSRPK